MYRKICVTNRALAERPFLEQLACVLATKPYAMILREKDLTEEGYEELAGKVKKLCENTDTRLILHSFPDAAMHLGCTAIHMPLHRFTKMPEEQKQKFLVRGVSVHSVEDARLAEQCGATYLTAGHVFVTDCKKGLAPRGLDFLHEVCSSVKIPNQRQKCSILYPGGSSRCVCHVRVYEDALKEYRFSVSDKWNSEYGSVKPDLFPNYIYRHIILSGYNFKHVFR